MGANPLAGQLRILTRCARGPATRNASTTLSEAGALGLDRVKREAQADAAILEKARQKGPARYRLSTKLQSKTSVTSPLRLSTGTTFSSTLPLVKNWVGESFRASRRLPPERARTDIHDWRSAHPAHKRVRTRQERKNGIDGEGRYQACGILRWLRLATPRHACYLYNQL